MIQSGTFDPGQMENSLRAVEKMAEDTGVERIHYGDGAVGLIAACRQAKCYCQYESQKDCDDRSFHS